RHRLAEDAVPGAEDRAAAPLADRRLDLVTRVQLVARGQRRRRGGAAQARAAGGRGLLGGLPVRVVAGGASVVARTRGRSARPRARGVVGTALTRAAARHPQLRRFPSRWLPPGWYTMTQAFSRSPHANAGDGRG